MFHRSSERSTRSAPSTVLINNAGVAIYDDLSNLDVIEQHLAVNFFGLLK